MTLANQKDDERNGKGGISFNVKPSRGIHQKSRLYKSEGQGTLHHMQKISRRSQRKHFKPKHGADSHKYRLAAYCISESIILDSISDTIKLRKLKTGENWRISAYNDVIHCYLEVRWGPYFFPNPIMLCTSGRICVILQLIELSSLSVDPFPAVNGNIKSKYRNQ